ncbi:MAG: sensor histidine kinase [Anaerolineae bacterium]
MIVLDLQWVVFGLLCIGLALGGLILWLVEHRVRHRMREHVGAAPGTLSLLEETPLGVLVLEGGALAYANRNARQLLHLGDTNLDALPQTDWAELLHEDLVAAREQADTGVEGDDSFGRYRSVTFASGRTARWWVSARGPQEIVLLLDVSAQRRAQQVSRTLVSDLGHELRTPIATLLTHLEILGLDDVGEEVRRQSLQLAKRESQRMSRLVNDMLELGRLEMVETLTRRPVDLQSLAQEVVIQSTPHATERAMSLELISPSTVPLVLGNADRLRQVLLNLLDNALKYAGRGTNVTIALRPVSEGVMCEVCDDGAGIPAAHLPHVTQRFYRAASETVDGSGLGLALVQEILRHHDSELVVVSPVREGRGTCVRFTLPRADEGGVREPS